MKLDLKSDGRPLGLANKKARAATDTAHGSYVKEEEEGAAVAAALASE